MLFFPKENSGYWVVRKSYDMLFSAQIQIACNLLTGTKLAQNSLKNSGAQYENSNFTNVPAEQ